MARKKWNLGKIDKDLAAEYATRFSIDPFAALLLSGKNIDISEFVDDSLSLSDPFLLPDMQKAVDRINDAIFDFEPICIYGDYDADGVTSTALLYSYLEAQGANVTYMLPNRITDGYGLNFDVIDKIAKLGTKLIITVDNGIAAIEEAKRIKELGMDLVITDHHLPGDSLPDCCAVVDPHRSDSNCPYSDFAGVGVTFKLCCAIEGDTDTILYDFAYLVALGTVADIVPLTGENRILVKRGLKSLNEYTHPGINALISICNFKEKLINSSCISFGLAPRINAAGRMDTAETALELLITEEPEAADEQAEILNKLNADRHLAEEKIISACKDIFSKDPGIIHKPVIIVSGEDWHEGILGIVASKILEKYLKPVIVLTIKDGIAKGSARSIEGFSIFEALNYCQDYLMVFGGHAGAAGLTLKAENIPGFYDAICNYAYQLPSLFYPTTLINCKLNSENLNTSLVDAISILEPFGAENPLPQFGLFEMIIDNISAIGDKKQHLRITAHKDGKTKPVTMVYFGATKVRFPYSVGEKVDFIVTLSKNEWNGDVKLSVLIKDVRSCNINEDEMVKSEHIFDKVALRRNLSVEEAKFALPSRDLFASVYIYLKRNGGFYNTYEYIFSKCAKDTDNQCRVRVALEALKELGLICINEDNSIEVPVTTEKADLLSAPILKYINSFLNE